MIVTGLLGYCWACACTWAAADSGSSQKHAIIRECEHNLTFMSPARDQFARTTRVSARARCLSLWPKRLPAETEESALTSHSSPPTNDPPTGLGKEHNDAASVASEVTSHSFDDDSRIDIVGERRAVKVDLQGAARSKAEIRITKSIHPRHDRPAGQRSGLAPNSSHWRLAMRLLGGLTV